MEEGKTDNKGRQRRRKRKKKKERRNMNSRGTAAAAGHGMMTVWKQFQLGISNLEVYPENSHVVEEVLQRLATDK